MTRQLLHHPARLAGPAALVAVALASPVTGQDTVPALDRMHELLAAWGPCPAPCDADLDANGVVDERDLRLLLAPPPVNDGVPEGFKLIDGDIIVPEDFDPQGMAAGTYASNLWVNGLVPYQFDTNVIEDNRTKMRDAMDEWEAVAPVTFVEIDDDPYLNYVHIQDADRNNSFVGMQGGQQVINIKNWSSHFTIVHELGHCLGLWHEQSRADRDQYIEIHHENIDKTIPGVPCCNFAFYFPQGIYGSGEWGPYDFDSVMHYSRCAFSICDDCQTVPGCETITVKPEPFPLDYPELVGCDSQPDCQDHIGQRQYISALDQMTMRFMYAPADWIFLQPDWAGPLQTGIFFLPFDELDEALAATPSGGTLHIDPGAYGAVGVHSAAMTIKAPLGGVVLGN